MEKLKEEGDMFVNMDNWFQNINIPVIICRPDSNMHVEYENKSAIRLLNPLQQTENAKKKVGLKELIHMDDTRWKELIESLDRPGDIPAFSVLLTLYSGEKSYADLSVGRILYEGEVFLQICITALNPVSGQRSLAEANDMLLQLVYKARTSEDAIQDLLQYAGEWTGSSRSYIFESVSETNTSNTYEWCAAGIRSEMEHLRDLPKDEYSYDAIIDRGLAVTDDIRKLSPEDRAILEAQGIKALAVIPMIVQDGPLGYVGFDDCKNYRIWTRDEVHFLKNLADLLASLIVRRNTERSLQYSLQVLNSVTNSQESLILVIDVYSGRLLFTNYAFSAMTQYNQEELKGRKLMDILQEDGVEGNYKNPLDKMIGTDGQIEKRDLQWEYYVAETGKWYLVRDSIITWIDGRDAMIETATEITNQKNYEAELEYQASRDMMTDTYNREWSQKLLENILEDSRIRPNNVLVFIDLDRLKITNDKYGHAAGDEMILNIVGHIRACIRKSDVLCRWGGDEFLMVLRATKEQAEGIIAKVWKRMELHNRDVRNKVKLSFSYGVVEIDANQYSTVEALVKAADEKMYLNKQRLKQ